MIDPAAASDWLRRWDAQQQAHIPDREERFDAIIDALAAAAGSAPRALDLGCGPGSLSVRVLDRLPGAEVVAIDADPVLLAIGRSALAGRTRLHFVDADLRGDWVARLPLPVPFDAAVTTTALHWLGLRDLVRLYRSLAGVLRPGAVLLNGDRLDFDHDQHAIASVVSSARSAWNDPGSATEDYDAWWQRATADPALADATDERRRRGHDHPHDEEVHTYEFHRAALFAAGFAEVGTVWQRSINRVLIALR